ncbi:MAG: biotin/lipoyl-containing protein [Planctomycetota bacterium]
MKYFAAVGDRCYECTVEADEQGTFVRVDGRRYRVDLEHIGATGAYTLLVDGRSYEFALHDREGSGERIELTGAAGRFSVLVEDERTRAAREVAAPPAAAKGPAVIHAIMPGMVREVLVREGGSVKKGAALLILEAMKMQNEIRADRPGTVSRVHVRAGATVEKGAPLLEIA